MSRYPQSATIRRPTPDYLANISAQPPMETPLKSHRRRTLRLAAPPDVPTSPAQFPKSSDTRRPGHIPIKTPHGSSPAWSRFTTGSLPDKRRRRWSRYLILSHGPPAPGLNAAPQNHRLSLQTALPLHSPRQHHAQFRNSGFEPPFQLSSTIPAEYCHSWSRSTVFATMRSRGRRPTAMKAG